MNERKGQHRGTEDPKNWPVYPTGRKSPIQKKTEVRQHAGDDYEQESIYNDYNAVHSFPQKEEEMSQADVDTHNMNAYQNGCTQLRNGTTEACMMVAGKLVQTSQHPFSRRPPDQPNIEWVTFEKQRNEWSKAFEEQVGRSAEHDFDALNAFLDEYQYDGKQDRADQCHEDSPVLAEKNSFSTLSGIMKASAGQQHVDNQEVDLPTAHSTRRLNNNHFELERDNADARYLKSAILPSKSESSVDEEEIRAAAQLSGIPLNVVDVVLGQAKKGITVGEHGKRSTKTVENRVRISSAPARNGVLFDSDSGEVFEPEDAAAENVQPSPKNFPQEMQSEDVVAGNLGPQPSFRSFNTDEAVDNSKLDKPITIPKGTGRAIPFYTNRLPPGRDPSPKVDRLMSPIAALRSPKVSQEDIPTEVPSEEDMQLLNRFIEVSATGFDGKKLSSDSEARVRTAALKVGLSEKFVDQMIQQAYAAAAEKKKPHESQSGKFPHTPQTHASQSGYYTVDVSRSNTEKKHELAGCYGWESIQQNFAQWLKPMTCGGRDDASSVSSEPTISWEEDARNANDKRRAYV